MNFEEYLHSKKIDCSAFKSHEGELWESWKKEFDLLHPTSFTAQKLYLINPIRRKYQLKVSLPSSNPAEENAFPTPSETLPGADAEKTEVSKTPLKSPMAKPLFRPKPKMN